MILQTDSLTYIQYSSNIYTHIYMLKLKIKVLNRPIVTSMYISTDDQKL